MCSKQRRAEKHRDVHALREDPLVFNIEGAPDVAPTAVAADEIVRFDGFRLSGFLVEDFGCDRLTGLLKRFEGCFVTNLDVRQRVCVGAQHGIEIGLRNPQPAFGTVGRARCRIAIGRMIEAGDLVAVHARDEKIISRIVRRIARLKAHAIGDAPAAQMFAGAGVGEIGRGKIDAAVGLFDDQTANIAVSKLDR